MRPNHGYWQTNGINKTSTSDRIDIRWQLGFQWHRRGIELVFKSLFHKATISQCNHFVAATYVFVVWNFIRLITRLKSFFWFFFTLDLVGEFCAVYWSLGRRGYFGVSNVALVAGYSYCFVKLNINVIDTYSIFMFSFWHWFCISYVCSFMFIIDFMS